MPAAGPCGDGPVHRVHFVHSVHGTLKDLMDNFEL